MARTEEDIRRSLAESLKGKPLTVLAEVKSVDQTARTCDIDDDGVIMYGVRLQCIINGNTGIVIYPKTGCQVLCARIEESDYYSVVHASEIDKLEIKIQDKSLALDSNGFVFNEGTIGAVKADKMVEWMMKVYNDLTTIQALLLTSPVAGNGANLAISFTPQTPSPQLSYFADDKLKH